MCDQGNFVYGKTAWIQVHIFEEIGKACTDH